MSKKRAPKREKRVLEKKPGGSNQKKAVQFLREHEQRFVLRLSVF